MSVAISCREVLTSYQSIGWHSTDQQKKRKRCGGNFYTVRENPTFLFYFGGEGFRNNRRMKR